MLGLWLGCRQGCGGSWAGHPGPEAPGTCPALVAQASGSMGAPAAGPGRSRRLCSGQLQKGLCLPNATQKPHCFPLGPRGARAPGFPGWPRGRSLGLRTLPGWAETWSFPGSGPGAFPPHQGSGSGLEGQRLPTARGDSPSSGRAEGPGPWGRRALRQITHVTARCPVQAQISFGLGVGKSGSGREETPGRWGSGRGPGGSDKPGRQEASPTPA